VAAAPPVDRAALLPSCELHLRADRKDPGTVKSYGDRVRRFLGWSAERGARRAGPSPFGNDPIH